MDKIQIVAIAGSIIFLIFIIEAIRKERVKEAYSLIWLIMGAVFLTMSFWREGLDKFSALIGIAYPPAALFLILLVTVIFVLIQYSAVISRQTEQIKNLTQELALLKEQVERQRDKDRK